MDDYIVACATTGDFDDSPAAESSPPACPILVGDRTQLPDGYPYFKSSAYPTLNSATVTFVSGRSGLKSPRKRPSVGDSSKENIERRLRRARTDARRYVMHNRLTVLVTLTFDPDFLGKEDRELCMDAVGAVTEGLRAIYGPLPWLFTAEYCPGGSGWHVHLLLSRWVPKDLLVRLWPHGIVDRVDGRRRFRGKSQSVEEVAKNRAMYVSKWTADDLPASGKKLYRTALGFKPPKLEFYSAGLGGALAAARIPFNGRAPRRFLQSDDWDGWSGPPTFLLEF